MSACIQCGRSPAPLVFDHGEDGPYCQNCVDLANAAPPETHLLTFRPATGSSPDARGAEDPHKVA